MRKRRVIAYKTRFPQHVAPAGFRGLCRHFRIVYCIICVPKYRERCSMGNKMGSRHRARGICTAVPGQLSPGKNHVYTRSTYIRVRTRECPLWRFDLSAKLCKPSKTHTRARARTTSGVYIENYYLLTKPRTTHIRVIYLVNEIRTCGT